MGTRWGLVLAPAVFLALLALGFPGCRGREDAKAPAVPAEVLFASRCTPCHGWEEAARIHGSEETVLQLIQRMRDKGAQLSQVEAMSIAGFLSAPSRHVFEARCTKCHGMDTVLSAHRKGRMTVETVEKMRRKKGADISPEDEAAIREYVNRYYFAGPDG